MKLASGKTQMVLAQLALVTTCLLLCAHGYAQEAAKPVRSAFYVAPDGNDEWSGRLLRPNPGRTDGPFASITRARAAIRALKAGGDLPGPVKVFIHGGTYRLSEPLVFEPQDSGTEQYPISYEALGDEKPIFSGGRQITGWRKVEEGLWEAEVPEARSDEWYFRQLFVNGRRTVRARNPNEGFLTAPKPAEPDPRSPFHFKPGDLRKYHGLDDVMLTAHHFWSCSYMRIADVDEEKSLVTLNGALHYSPGHWFPEFRYEVDNAFELLDAPGEWYLSRNLGTVYYRPRPGEDMQQAEIIAPMIHQLVKFAGDASKEQLVGHIHLRDLAFRHGDWIRRRDTWLEGDRFVEGQSAYRVEAAIDMRGAVYCSLEDCEIAHVGEHGLWLGPGCRNNLIAGCHLWDLGAGGIMIGEKPKREAEAEQAAYNEVSDCHIHDGGIVFHGGTGIWISQSHHNLIAHNHIHNFTWSGVAIGMQWEDMHPNYHHNVVEFNHIHDVCQMMGDDGGIYTYGNMPGSILRNNLIHDLRGARRSVRGIFLDGMSGGLLIRDNIVYRVLDSPLDPATKNEECPNVYINNIFAFPQNKTLLWNKRYDGQDQALHNIVYGVENVRYLIKPQLPAENYTRRVNDNLYWHPEAEMAFNEQSFAQWQALGFDTRSIIADPLFTDPAHGDFSMPLDSPAWDIGFEPIDMSTVGPRRDLKWQPPNSEERD